MNRTDLPWPELVEQLLKHSMDPARLKEVARLIGMLGQLFLDPVISRKYFNLWQSHGFHLTPVHYYSPIPGTRSLPDEIWTSKSELVGFEMNDQVQLELMQEAFPRFESGYKEFPAAPTENTYQFHFNNPMFDGVDALVLYCMVRHFAPRVIIELGSGFSSRVSAQAALQNGNTDLICVEPHPSDLLEQGFPGLTSLIAQPVQDIGLEIFGKLISGNILFVDTSHVVKTGGDVNYIYLEIIPRLNPGVIVHIHDIFVPREYPREWVKELTIFYSEQYLLEAFLQFNSAYEVLLCNSYFGGKYPEAQRRTFPNSPTLGGSSFWMRRK